MTRAILTCSPYFMDFALNEVRRSHPHLTLVESLAPGYLLLQAPYSFDKLTRPWRHNLPVYLHHLFPVHAVVALDGSQNDWTLLQQAIREIAPSDSIIQLRSAIETDLSYPVSEIIPSRCTPQGRIVSVLVVPDSSRYRVYLGVSWATQNLSPWAGGQIPITEAVSNRAGYKLLEALDAFAIRLRKGDLALDLGAAPGAWTTILRRRGLFVTAVAPAPLYPWLAHDTGVRYHPMLAEEFVNQCQTTFDLIVNDMKLDVQDSAQLMIDYARHLRPEGIAIMTLKLRQRNRQRVMDHNFRILRQAYKIIRVRQLVSNRNEVTLFLRRKA